MKVEYSVAELVPHSGKMSLLDTIIDYGDGWLHAEVHITPECGTNSLPNTQPSLNTPINLVTLNSSLDAPLSYVLSNTFAFGGNNISLLLGRIQ